MNTSTAVVSIVDDDASIHRALGRLLTSHGYKVRNFMRAEEFLNATHSDDPGCVLLDAFMPGMDGLALQEVVATSARRYPLIFLSGSADVSTCAAAMKMGAVDFLTKPCTAAKLLDAVERAIRMDLAVRSDWLQRLQVDQRVAKLTPREREVMTLMISGHMNKQMAFRLGCAVRTIKVHRGRVMEKMQTSSLAELVWIAALIHTRWQPTSAPVHESIPRRHRQALEQFAC